MKVSEKDLLAAEAMDRWGGFPEESFLRKAQVSHPTVSKILVGSITLRRIDES